MIALTFPVWKRIKISRFVSWMLIKFIQRKSSTINSHQLLSSWPVPGSRMEPQFCLASIAFAILTVPQHKHRADAQ